MCMYYGYMCIYIQNVKFYDQTFGWEDCPQTTPMPKITPDYNTWQTIQTILYQMSQKVQQCRVEWTRPHPHPRPTPGEISTFGTEYAPHSYRRNFKIFNDHDLCCMQTNNNSQIRSRASPTHPHPRHRQFIKFRSECNIHVKYLSNK